MITSKQRAYLRSLSVNLPAIMQIGKGGLGENLIKTVESGDEVDIASDAIEGTLLDALGAQDSKRLQLINNALDRIIQGKYGRCLKCGREIPEERLRALPYALMCIQCTTEEERRHR